MEQSATLEKAILLLAEVQAANALFSKIAIGMLCIEAFMLLLALYVVWKVHEDTTYLRRKSESGD